MMGMVGLTRTGRFTGVGIVLMLVALSAGCLGRSPAADHFVLGSNGLLSLDRRAPDLAVLIGPVRLPAYLDRPQMARLHSGGEVELDEYARWLGGFETNFLRAVVNAHDKALASFVGQIVAELALIHRHLGD